MAAVVSYHQFLFFLLTSFTLAPCLARDFSFVFVLSDSLWDFGLDFRSNIARINLQNLLTQRHPNVTISHEVAHIPSPAFDECDRRFAAWGAAGVPLVLANVREQFCFARLAPAFPNTTFISAGSSPSGPQLRRRLYQPTYLAGYTAGLMTTVNKICVSTIQPISSVLLDLTGFCHGVHAANPAAEIHVFGTGKIIAPLLEVWIVNQSYAFGCDVMFVHSTFIDGTQRASELGLLSVGYFIDARLTVGETVLTSVMLDLTPGYLRAAEAVLTNTLEAETQRADWWMGWEWGAMALADFSFRVPKSVQAKVLAQVPALDRVFCGRVCTKKGCVCNSSSCCLTDKQLNSLDGQPDFVLDHGVVRLPGEACPPGQLATWHVNAFVMQCSDCPAGTYAYNRAQTSECRPCPAGTYSPPRATDCTPCPPGTFSDGPGQAQCRLCPAGTIAHNPASVSCSLCSSSLPRMGCGPCIPQPTQSYTVVSLMLPPPFYELLLFFGGLPSLTLFLVDDRHTLAGTKPSPEAPPRCRAVAAHLRWPAPDQGSDGPPLQRTLDGLVKRALPATVQQQRPRPPLCRQPAGRESGQFDSLPGVPAHSDAGHGRDYVHPRDLSGEELLPDSPRSVHLPLAPENAL